ncbi:MAG: response regulator [Chitinophagaceae bacterium]|nr:MAG: response regulator [Chitinophagaceae bacterium]
MEDSPIIIVDDDQDDLDLIADVAQALHLSRPIHFLKTGDALIDLLKGSTASPFLIVCDLNLPGDDGFTVKKRVAEHPDLKYKSVPFIFWSTDASEKQIQHAYDLPAQGFFFKPQNFDDLCDTFKTILSYWTKSQHPKKVV